MAFLAVITADGGVPIFTRSSEDIKVKLPFAAIGALNGVHLFSRLRSAELKSAETPDEKIIWKEYHEKLVLILISRHNECSDCHLYSLLDNIFATITMMLGIDTLLNQNEFMRLQKSLVACYPLIDFILNDRLSIASLTQASECILSSKTSCLQESMVRFLDIADSFYSFLSIRGIIVAASKEWWSLTGQERFLICSYANCLPKDISKEAVIYLPTSSPKHPNRLVIVNLLQDIEVCVLCTSEPPLSVLAEEARKIFIEDFGLLKSICNLYPRNIPIDMDLDRNILSFLIINTEKKQSVCSLQPISSNSKAKLPKIDSFLCLKEQQEPLKILFKLVSGTYFKNMNALCPSLSSSVEEQVEQTSNISFEGENFEAAEFYVCLDFHKCFVINEFPYQLYALFNDEIPKYALRSVAHRSLKILTERYLFP